MSELVLPGPPQIWTPDYGALRERLTLPKWAKPWERTKEDALVEAIGVPTLQGGSVNVVTSANQASFTRSGVTIPAASLVLVVIGYGSGSTMPTISTVSDGTNSYTKAATDNRSFVSADLWYFYDTAGRSAVTITATPSNTNANISWVAVYTCSSAASSSPLDTTDNRTGTGGTTGATVSTSGNVAQADEVALFACCYSVSTAATTWPPTGYTSLYNNNNATRTKSLMIAYKTPLTAGSPASAGGWALAASANWAAPLATFKGGSSTTPVSNTVGAVLEALAGVSNSA